MAQDSNLQHPRLPHSPGRAASDQQCGEHLRMQIIGDAHYIYGGLDEPLSIEEVDAVLFGDADHQVRH